MELDVCRILKTINKRKNIQEQHKAASFFSHELSKS